MQAFSLYFNLLQQHEVLILTVNEMYVTLQNLKKKEELGDSFHTAQERKQTLLAFQHKSSTVLAVSVKMRKNQGKIEKQ